MKMKKLDWKIVLVSVLGACCWSGYATAGVVGSQHDLTTGGQAQGSTGNTDEVCVFCHTPHGSDTAAPVPLWNKSLGSLPRVGSYETYADLGTSTLDGATVEVGSVSIACWISSCTSREALP